jgi:cobalt/nickel transport system permease protein
MSPDLLAPYSGGESCCHRLSPAIKIVAAGTLLVIALLLPFQRWPLLGVIGCLAWVGHALAGVPAGYLVRRLLLLVPFLLALGVGMLGLAPRPEQIERFGLVAGRMTVTLLLSLWVVNTTPLVLLVGQFRQWGLPAILASILLLAWRYMGVLFDELARVRTARRSRTLAPVSWWGEWVGLGQALAMVLIRALDRAEQVHQAMEARGWSGGWEAATVPLRRATAVGAAASSRVVTSPAVQPNAVERQGVTV